MAIATVTDTRYITLDNLNRFLSNLQNWFKTSDDMFGGIKIGYTENDRNRAVQLDKDGRAYIVMPELKIPVATDNEVGGIKIGYNSNQTDDLGNRPVLLDNYDRAYVNVPAATASTFGCIKIGYNDGKDDNSHTGNGYKRFPLLLNNGQAHVDIKYAYAYNGASGENNNGGLITYAEWQTLYGHIDFFKSIIGYDNGKVEWNEANATLKKVNATSSEGKPYYYFTIPLANDETALGKIGGIKLGYTQNNRNYPVKLDSEGRAFVNVPWEAGEGGGETVIVTPDMTEVTYAELLKMVNGDEDVNGVVQSLVPGAKYRITDFVTTISDDYNLHNNVKIKSAKNQFDIIVTALTEHSLSEDAKACISVGKTYFNRSKLENWELKYCINNDTSRFHWADANGKGVIYYMKDEYDNECPYDFKNILYDGYYTFDFATYNPDTEDFINHKDASIRAFDASITNNDKVREACAKNNIISKYIHPSEYQELNNIICVFESKYHKIFLPGQGDAGETFRESGLNGNFFGVGCHDIELYNPVYNRFESGCHDIYIYGSACLSNLLNKNCNNFKISYDFENNKPIFINGDDSDDKWAPIQFNKFGLNCNEIKTNKGFSYNTFGNNCGYFEFGENCRYNIIGDNCTYFEFGKYFIKNTIADNNFKVDNVISDDNKTAGNVDNVKYGGLYYGTDSDHQSKKPVPYVSYCEFGPNTNVPIIVKYYGLLNYNYKDNNGEYIVGSKMENNNIFQNYKFINLQTPESTTNNSMVVSVLDGELQGFNEYSEEDIRKNNDNLEQIATTVAENLCNRLYVTTVAGTVYEYDSSQNLNLQYISENIYDLISTLKKELEDTRKRCVQFERACAVAFGVIDQNNQDEYRLGWNNYYDGEPVGDWFSIFPENKGWENRFDSQYTYDEKHESSQGN